jgi:mono/diheme cytochrome c family protein
MPVDRLLTRFCAWNSECISAAEDRIKGACMRTRIICSLVISLASVGVLGAETKIKNVPLAKTSPISGTEMFSHYCAACHGPDGKGNGPAAPALKKAPTDLTRLAANNGGVFPERSVRGTLASGAVVAHGSQEMPIWGDLLRSLGPDPNIVHLRLANLTAYVKSIQAK